MTTPVYPGSLDGITFGHISAIQDTAEAFGGAVAAIGNNPKKNYMFSLAERVALAEKALENIPGVTVMPFSGLLVNFMVRNNLNVIVRGLRNGQDLDDAMLQENVGWQQILAKDIKAFYVPTRPGHAFISSTALKGVLQEQGDALHMAPLSTIHAVQARMMGQYFYGITGMSGSGKSSLARKFVEIAKQRHIPLVHVDLDKFGHAILGEAEDPLYEKVRGQIVDAFGPGILDKDGFIVRKKLGAAVFGDPDKLKKLNDIMHDPIFFRMNDFLRGQKGLFLIDTALLAEINKTQLVNNNVMLVEASDEDIAKRLGQRDGLDAEQLKRRIASQFNTAAKAEIIEKNISKDHYGSLARVNTSVNFDDAAAERAFDGMLTQTDIFGELRITGFFKTLGIADAAAAYQQVRKFYAADDRLYHALSRVVEGIDQIPAFKPQLTEPDAFMLAWLFRDAVHNTHAADNAARSAAMMAKSCAAWGVDANLVARAKNILLNDGASPATDRQFFLDLGNLPFAAEPAAFDKAQKNIRLEFNWMTKKDWVQFSRKKLDAMTAPYFQTAHFQQKLSAQADRNIKALKAAGA